MNPVQPTHTSWRPSPFIVGHRYRVRQDFQAQREPFKEGDILTYERDAYSAYHGCTGYFFSKAGMDRLLCWDVADNEDPARWSEWFEEIPG